MVDGVDAIRSWDQQENAFAAEDDEHALSEEERNAALERYNARREKERALLCKGYSADAAMEKVARDESACSSSISIISSSSSTLAPHVLVLKKRMTDAQVARVREKANGAGAILDIMYNASLTTHVVSVYDAAQLKRWKERVGCAGKTLVFCTPEAFCASREEKTEVKERVLVLRRRMSTDDRDAVRAALAQCAVGETLEFGPLVQTVVSSWVMLRLPSGWREWQKSGGCPIDGRAAPSVLKTRVLEAAAAAAAAAGERRAIVEWLPGTARVPFMVGSDGAESRLLGFTVGFFSEARS